MAQRKFGRIRFGILALAVLIPLWSFADKPPRIANARVETRAAAPNLDAAFRAILNAQTAPAWIGYAGPLAGPPRQMCCWNSSSKHERCCGACQIGRASCRERV